ncbi:mycofactocin biosynthesis chaperone MftB [Streptomyces sp. NPDC057293]|uniref:mycofactocin biosynthesis chaperone MftB n=1 Tax=unclassified Streptomyces TaxID=2593676 RepID=UPI00363E7D4A
MFHPDRPYRCAPSVALRPERFGALAYDFRTRRLSFLKSPELVSVVTALAGHPDVHSALEGAGVPPARRDACLRALATLAKSGVVEARERVAERAA